MTSTHAGNICATTLAIVAAVHTAHLHADTNTFVLTQLVHLLQAMTPCQLFRDPSCLPLLEGEKEKKKERSTKQGRLHRPKMGATNPSRLFPTLTESSSFPLPF
jgi:hypothetical protein